MHPALGLCGAGEGSTMSRPIAQAATTLGELLRRVNSLSTRERLDELELERLKREARKLIAVNPAEGHSVLGAIAAVEWNQERATEHHRDAIRAENSDLTHLFYSTSLQFMGYMREALEEALVAYQLAPEDGSRLREAFGLALGAGAFQAAEDIILRWEKSFPNAPLKDPESMALLETVLEEVRRQSLSEEQIQQAIELAYALCRQGRVRPRGWELDVVPLEDADGGYDIVSTVFIEASVERATEMTMELFDKVDEYPELQQGAWKGFLVSFESVRGNADLPE